MGVSEESRGGVGVCCLHVLHLKCDRREIASYLSNRPIGKYRAFFIINICLVSELQAISF